MELKMKQDDDMQADGEAESIEYKIDDKRKFIVSPVYQKYQGTGKSINEILLNLMRREVENF